MTTSNREAGYRTALPDRRGMYCCGRAARMRPSADQRRSAFPPRRGSCRGVCYPAHESRPPCLPLPDRDAVQKPALAGDSGYSRRIATGQNAVGCDDTRSNLSQGAPTDCGIRAVTRTVQSQDLCRRRQPSYCWQYSAFRPCARNPLFTFAAPECAPVASI